MDLGGKMGKLKLGRNITRARGEPAEKNRTKIRTKAGFVAGRPSAYVSGTYVSGTGGTRRQPQAQEVS